ncbi:unnamed protein product [Arabis nemorensis]|uniref:PNO1 second type I KH domain-containing protein n=1 Tax=Arabis nemorensis TaxID=586526 RepID=A0A565BEW4_9BRAS|nr:unnamed protein product [Arabis nemorensis]
MLGFDIPDAISLLRTDELYVESFEIKDVKTLKGEHQLRAIRRLSGKGGKTRFAIENSTKTRIVIADTKNDSLVSENQTTSSLANITTQQREIYTHLYSLTLEYVLYCILRA